ncbi:MAG TPA: tyrosine-type recombinase/integrase [Hyphomicrobiaceae bacterium]|nr:tyrosine-type recombinase/integrase [Hyphomicrobiaceae bacterium]
MTKRVVGLNRLSATFLRQTKKPGVYLDGGGLYLKIAANGTRRWFVRIVWGGKRIDVALGTVNVTSLAEARVHAATIRKAVVEGRNPRTAVTDMRTRKRRSGLAGSMTFEAVWNLHWELKKVTLATEKDRKAYANMMQRNVIAVFGARPVADIQTGEVVEMLRPIWTTKEETARKVFERARAVFTYALTTGHRTAANPCEGVAELLGKRIKPVEHRRALLWQDVPAFIVSLRKRGGLVSSRLAFEFLILTATRSNETRGALWNEISFAECLWTIPGYDEVTGRRMKTSNDHVVPLSARAIEILREAKKANPKGELVFPGLKGQPLSDATLTKRLKDMGLRGEATAHGFRSSFKDWCADNGVDDHLSELALSHADPDQARAAYRRTALLASRRKLMEDWAAFCCGSPVSNKKIG